MNSLSQVTIIFIYILFLFYFLNITTLYSSKTAGAFCSRWTSSVTPHGQNSLVWEE